MRKPKRTWTDEQFIEAVKNNISIADTIRELGLVVGGANYKQVHLNVERLELDTSHWKGRGHGKTCSYLKPGQRRPLEDILVENSPHVSTNNLKTRLYKEGLLTDKCEICGLGPEWNGQPLVFALDHINGNNRDNRLKNLRLLCPNCDSQQPTFRRPKTNRFSRFCPDCGERVSYRSKSGYCKDCVRHHQTNRNQHSK